MFDLNKYKCNFLDNSNHKCNCIDPNYICLYDCGVIRSMTIIGVKTGDSI